MINTKRKENFKKLVLTFLVSVVSVCLVLVLKLKFLKFIINLIQSHSIALFIGITALNLTILILGWEKSQRYWVKYKETKRTGTFPIIFVELLGIYLLLFAIFLVFYVYSSASKLSIVLSKEFIVFVVVNAAFFLIWLSTSFYYKQKSPGTSIIIHEEVLFDNPITAPEQDSLRREKFVDDLYRQIINLPTKKTGSFTFGLYGGWGEGKTSVINLLSIKLAETRDLLLIRFDPWYFQNEDAILTSFYNQIEKAFSDTFIFPAFKKMIQKYQKAIAPGISLAGFSFDLKATDLAIEQIRERIERYIEQINRRVVIIIDDIDRLDQDEMDLVFKLVRKNTNFKNTIFLLSFDHTVVKKSFMSIGEGNEEFLEKVINKPVYLPAIEPENIDEFIFGHIGKLLEFLDIPSQDRSLLFNDFATIYRANVYKLFKTLRQAKRYINSLHSTLPPIKSEVNLYDFLLLEIIKIFNDELYKDIWSNPWYYIEIGLNYRMIFSSPFTFLQDKNKKNEIIKKHIEKLLENTSQSPIFENILQKLFPDIIGRVLSVGSIRFEFKNFGKKRVEKWISHIECFPKYFTLLTPSSEVSDEYIEVTIDLWRTMNPDERKSLIKAVVLEGGEYKKPAKMMQKLMDFRDKIDPASALSIIEVIYENADRFLKNDEHSHFDSEFHKAEGLMLLLINDKIGKKMIQVVLEKAVMNTPDLLFSVVVVRRCKDGKEEGFSNIVHSIDIEQLQDQLSRRLKEYFIDDKRDVFEIISERWFPFLAQWGSNWMSLDGKNSEIVNSYVLSLVKDDAKKFSNFLMKCARKGETDKFVDLENFNDIFNYEDFEVVARKFRYSEKLSDEEKDVIKQFLEQAPKKSPQ